MTGSDEQFARRIAGLLDRSAEDIPAGIAYRLREARARALDGAPAPAAADEPALAHALAGGAGLARLGPPAGIGRGRNAWRLGLVLAVLLVAAFLGLRQWNAYRQVQAYEDLDAQILSSDLPIDAYLDRGFDAWLKASFDDE